MAGDAVFRIASDSDLPHLAPLRWRLKTGDDSPSEGAEFARFAEAFGVSERLDRNDGEVFHWVADETGTAVAVMSVVVVRKVMPVEGRRGSWGYLTNCYVVPEHRNSGLGSRLLQAVQAWAIDRGLEFLIVWPSERAVPFYERSGFERPEDLLVWTPPENTP